MTAKPTSGAAALPEIFSYPIHVADVPQSGLDISIHADAATLRALAAADNLPAISRLEADFHVVPKGKDRFNVSGEVKARITQICVVSLEPFESDVVEPVDVDFAPAAEAAAAAAAASMTVLGGAEATGAPEREPPDAIIDGMIDLGALASEFLALGLHPYPRKPGITFQPPAAEEGRAGEEARESPFGVLRKLKERK